MTGSGAHEGHTGGLASWLAFLGTPDCPCESEWRGLGVLYGVSFGNGWVRVTEHPDCPHHGSRPPVLNGKTAGR